MCSTKIYGFVALFTLFSLIACGSANEQEVRSSSTQTNVIPQSRPLDGLLEELDLTTGQTIFVPAYTGIYSGPTTTLNLTTTITIHNTDSHASIIINSIQHFGGNGKLIKDYVQTPVRLEPMATAAFYVERGEPQEGIGANFIVRWVSENDVHEPVVEALMISARGTHGFSFISPGRVLSQK